MIKPRAGLGKLREDVSDGFLEFQYESQVFDPCLALRLDVEYVSFSSCFNMTINEVSHVIMV